GAVIRIDPANGTQKSIAAGNLLTHPAGIAVDRGGRIFVAVPQKPGRIVKVDALTGAQESVSSGGLFSCPTGVASLANADLVVADPCAKMIIRIYHRTGAQDGRWVGPRLPPVHFAVARAGHNRAHAR
ncbi:MAG: hypothetical protein WAN81_23135, partial [Candidatus Binataceae bacterium]